MPDHQLQGSAPATLSRGDIDAIVQGAHRDPFAVLGPHGHHDGNTCTLVIRALRPGASAITLVPQGREVPAQPMALLHPAGLFETHTSPGSTAGSTSSGT